MSSLADEAGYDADIRRAATFMVDRYGRIAAARASRRACVLLLAGYGRAAATWTSIAALAEQLAVKIAPQPVAPAVSSVNVIPFRIRSPYPSGRVRPTAPSSTGRRVAVGRLIPSLSPSAGASRVPSPLRP